jgi:hypothetical protein
LISLTEQSRPWAVRQERVDRSKLADMRVEVKIAGYLGGLLRLSIWAPTAREEGDPYDDGVSAVSEHRSRVATLALSGLQMISGKMIWTLMRT